VLGAGDVVGWGFGDFWSFDLAGEVEGAVVV
jgi:hypothetical protein